LIREAREILAGKNRCEIGDFLIGQILAAPPIGEDGAWPHPAVRAVIEDLASPAVEPGVAARVNNSAAP